MTRGIEHAGITVPDIDQATDFFQKAFGAEICYDVLTPDQSSQKGVKAEHHLGLPEGAEIYHIRLLRLGNSSNIELFQIGKAEQTEPVQLPGYGLTHLALYVDDIGSATEKFQTAGGCLLSEPFPLPGVESGPRNVTVYGQAPWGMLLELISYPDGVDYPEDSRKRWTPGE
ncbi:VOC family protein [Sediminibacillus massiliensis]|uniref:VOC family protein n=1 Tax=Sediminibacillus massiliensis TaxID=1926277 RepID=UPI0009884CD2|nr:VOC family protein [Sediminibacillus massiliensis]